MFIIIIKTFSYIDIILTNNKNQAHRTYPLIHITKKIPLLFYKKSRGNKTRSTYVNHKKMQFTDTHFT